MATALLIDTVGRDVSTITDPLNYTTPESMISDWNNYVTETRAVPSNPSHSIPDFASSVDIKSVTLPYPRVELWGRQLNIQSIVSGGTLVLTTSEQIPDDTPIQTTMGKWGEYGLTTEVTYYVVNSAPGTFDLSLSIGGAPIGLADAANIGLTLTIVTPDVLAQVQKARDMYSSPHLVLKFCVKGESDDNRVRYLTSDVQNIRPYQFVLEKLGTDLDERTGMPVWVRFRALFDQVLRWGLKKPIIISFATIRGIPIDVFAENPRKFPVDEATAMDWKRSIIVAVVIPYARDAKYTNHFADIRE